MKRQFSITAVALCVLAMPVLADDEEWSFKIGGLLHTDSVSFSDDLTPIESDTDFRRARLKTQARYGDWRIRADYEFGLAEGWRSTFVEYSGFRKQRIVVGNQVAPFSMEDLTGSRYLSLTERSIASALSPGMLLGASWRTWLDQWSFHAGVFGDELSDLVDIGEAAQSEAVTGQRFVRHWMHQAMVRMGGEKMSKSLGNLVFVSELRKDWDAMAIRLALASHHYRTEWEWTDEVMPAASETLERWRVQGSGAAALDGVRERLDDDLDTSGAVAAIDAAVTAGEGASEAAMLLGIDILSEELHG